MGEMTVCYDDYGRAHRFPAAEVIFRPAVYGVLLDKNQVLLQRHRATGLRYPPGRILSLDEAPLTALLRHFRVLLGLAPIAGPLLAVEEHYYRDGEGRGLRLGVLYYALERPSSGLAMARERDGEPAPEWLPLAQLQREALQFGYDAIENGRLRLTYASRAVW